MTPPNDGTPASPWTTAFLLALPVAVGALVWWLWGWVGVGTWLTPSVAACAGAGWRWKGVGR